MDNQEQEELREFAREPDGSYRVDGDMLIGDIIQAFPKAAGIMLTHGLHCVGCHANIFDTIEGGARGHGIDDSEIVSMVDEINAAINKRIETIEITPKAVEKIKELRAQEAGKETWPLRIRVNPGDDRCQFGYELDFDTRKEADMRFDFAGLEVIVDPDSYALLQGASIEYVETASATGFKVDNPHEDGSCH